MTTLRVSYKEIIPELKIPEKWKEIILNTGGTQRTLQDIKLPQTAGGYWYMDTSKYLTKNRFITWQTTSESIDISEWSLDVNLKGSYLRCKVPAGTPPLNTVTVWEYGQEVIILVATISSVHRLIFPHPISLQGKKLLNLGVDNAISIFNDAKSGSANNPNNYHIFTQTSTACNGVCSSLLNSNGEAVFAVWCGSSSTEGLVLVVMAPNSAPISFSLRRDSAVPRFFSGITGALRGKSWTSEEWVCGLAVSKGMVWALWSDSCIRAWKPPTTNLIGVSQPIARIASEQHKYILKEATTFDESVVLVAFLSVVSECEFVVMKPLEIDGSIKFTEISRIFGPQLDLIDYSATYNNGKIAIWAIWVKPDGENVITRCVSGGTWERAESGKIYEDFREMETPSAYVEKLLEPANFPPVVVRKALQVYRRAWCGGGICSDQENLRDAVLRAVKARLERAPNTPQHRCWFDLYSWCVQYMESLSKPLGIFVSRDKCEEAWIVRGGGVSLVSKASSLHKILASPYDPPPAEELSYLIPDPSIRDDVWCVVRTAGILEVPDLLSSYQSQNSEPFSSPTEMLPPDIMNKITSTLEPVKDVQRAILVLNDVLRLDDPSIQRDKDNLDMSEEWAPYSSDLGVSIMTESLGQMARICVSILRGCGRACALTCGAIPGAGPLAVHYHAYEALLWLRSSALYNLRRGDKDEAWRLGLQSLGLRSDNQGIIGGSLASAWWRKRALNLTNARADLDHLVADMAYSLWAVSGGFEFGEWLVTIRQPKLVEAYVNMLEPWCEWNACSRLFILGVSLLDIGDAESAYTAFCKAAKGVSSEPFLLQIIGDQPQNHQQALVLYHLKVIKLFEIYEENYYVVRLAESAISIAERDNPNLTVFQWTVFSRRLQSGCVGRALSAAAALSSSRARANAANTLIRTLGAQGRLSELVAAGARGAIAEELEKAATSRAKLISPVNNVYCNYLYAEKIKRGHFRKAASVMYEQACRCQAEDSKTPTLLTARWKCLLIAVNCLRLTPKEHAFIAGQEGNVIDLDALVTELKQARAAIITSTRTNDVSTAASALCEVGLVREGLWLDSKAAIIALASHAAKSHSVEASQAYEELRKRLHNTDSELLQEVTSSILGARKYLPHWIFTQYLEKDAASLVRVLLRAGHLVAAARAACASPERALPACDALLLELKQHSDIPVLQNLYDEVKSAIKVHLQTSLNSCENARMAQLSHLNLVT